MSSPAQNASVHVSGSIVGTGGFYFRGGDGDVNGDGQLTLADANLVRDYVIGNETFTLPQRQKADVNGDGQVTELDANLIRDSFSLDQHSCLVRVKTQMKSIGWRQVANDVLSA